MQKRQKDKEKYTWVKSLVVILCVSMLSGCSRMEDAGEAVEGACPQESTAEIVTVEEEGSATGIATATELATTESIPVTEYS